MNRIIREAKATDMSSIMQVMDAAKKIMRQSGNMHIITFRLEGKIFVCLWLGGGKYDMKNGEPRIALKLAPERNEELRVQFHAVTPAYHWNKKHWSDVYYEQLDDAQVEEWIKESYQLVASKLPKAIRQKYIL